MTTAAEQNTIYGLEVLLREGAELLAGVAGAVTIADARERLLRNVVEIYMQHAAGKHAGKVHELVRSRDCMHALMSILGERSDRRTRFSVAKALWDVASQRPRPDLGEGFYAEMIQLIRGLDCRSTFHFMVNASAFGKLTGRQAALARSAARR